jgi:Tol biopolymer transport system component
MIRIRPALVAIALAVLVWTALPSADQSPEARALQEAIDLIESKGDFAAALAKLEIASKSRDRQVAARALWYTAQVNERTDLGRAVATYERVVAEFRDQQDIAAEARARLAVLQPAPSEPAHAHEPQMRRVWTGDRGTSLLADSRQLTYDADQNLILRAADGRTRVLTAKAPGATDHSAGWLLSRDERQLAYTWYRDTINRYEVRLASLDGDGIPPARVIYDNPEVNFTYPLDWSPDGSRLAVSIERKDRTRQLGLLSVADGTMRILRSTAWDQRNYAFFSPDGRRLAIDHDGDVAILSLDDLRASTVAAGPSDDRVMGWSPDGRWVVVSSDRRGSRDLFVVSVANGRATDQPRLVYGGLGDKSPQGVTASGGLQLEVNQTDVEVAVRAIDLATGAVGPRMVPPTRRFLGVNDLPDWSRDGKFLAYLSARPTGGGGRAIMIEDADTGAVAGEVRTSLGYSNALRWSPDGSAFLLSSSDAKGRIGVFTVDRATGRTTVIATPRDDYWRVFRPEWSADGRRVYYTVPANGSGVVLIEHVLRTGEERQILRRRSRPSFAPSPDGRWIAVTNDDWTVLQLLTAEGGYVRDLLRAGAGAALGSFGMTTLAWTADSANVLVNERPGEGTGRSTLWQVSVDGLTRRQLASDVPNGRLHPDGRRIAVTQQTARREIWLLENFLPGPEGR